jgi:hypothetical protein
MFEEDRRRHQRYAVTARRDCPLLYAGTSQVAGRIADVSRRGLRVVADAPIDEAQGNSFVIRSSWIPHDIPVTASLVWKDAFNGKSNYGAHVQRMNSEDIFDLLDCLYEDWLNEALHHNAV